MKQRFVVVSDVHSHYTPLKNALDEVNFNPNNDILISAGDLLDRGNETIETIKFILSLPKCIIVRGNHDILMQDLLDRGYSCSHDKHNGTERSYYQILNYYCDKLSFNKDPNDMVREVLTPLWRKMVNYCELKNHIFVHSWIPMLPEGKYNKVYMPNPEWRNASQAEWNEAMWGNPFDLADDGFNITNKTMVFGHWHTSGKWAETEGLTEFGGNAKFDIFYGKDYIGIDACTAYTKKVNALVIEDEFDEEWFEKYGGKI